MDDRGVDSDASRLATLDLSQMLRISVGLLWMAWALAWFNEQGQVAYAPWLNITALCVGLGVLAIAALPHDPYFWERFDRVVFCLAIIFLALWFAGPSITHPYGTDEVALGQTSASTVIHGGNPYTRDMSPELGALNPNPTVDTPTLDGQLVHTATYPALSFLVYVPLGLLLGTNSPFALLTDALFSILFLVLLWKLAPRHLRPLLPLVALSPFYASFVDGGSTDVIYLPFLLLALYRWDRYGETAERSVARWIGPVALGLACSVKPTPWLIAPLLVLGVAVEAHARGGPQWWATPLRYGLTAALVFVTVNLPFAVLNPAAWFRGAFLPILQPLVPLGNGIVVLATNLGIGGGQLHWLTLASLLGLLACTTTLVGWYPVAKRILPLLAILPLLLATRSLLNYFIYVPVVLIVSVGTVRDASRQAFHTDRSSVHRLSRVAAIGCAVAAGACVVLFAAIRPPLHVQLVGQVAAGNDGARVADVIVNVTNTSDMVIRPYLTVGTGKTTNTAFRSVSGPAELQPHSSATYRLESDEPDADLSRGDHFVVEAFSPSPAAISTSAQYTAS